MKYFCKVFVILLFGLFFFAVMCLDMLPTCVSALCVCIAQGGQKRAHNPQRLELKIFVSPQMSAGELNPSPLEEQAVLNSVFLSLLI